MKLLLTSSGINSKRLRNEFVRLTNNILETKVLVAHTAQKPEHYIFVHQVGQELAKAGILHPNIYYFNMIDQNNTPELENYNVVYICGGNTYLILDRMRKTGLANALYEFVRRGGIYVGVSAGSIIAGKSIEIAGWGSEPDSNNINLRDLNGLGFTEIAVFPHYKNSLRNEIKEFRRKVNYPIETIKDKEAILIDEKEIRKIKLAKI